MAASRRVFAFVLVFFAGILSCFQEREPDGTLAGTSVGTGNPGKLKVGFTENGTSHAFSGTVELYASTQITVPYFQLDPLLKFNVEKSDSLEISSSTIRSLPDSIWPTRSRIGDSVLLFNLVVKGDSIGSVVLDLALNSRTGRFQQAGKFLDFGSERLQGLDIELFSLDTIKAEMRPEYFTSNAYNYSFVYGTGYFAKWDGKHFLFPRVPRRFYTLSYISWIDPRTGPAGGIIDSTGIYRLQPQILPGKPDSLNFGEVADSVRLPEEFIKKPATP